MNGNAFHEWHEAKATTQDEKDLHQLIDELAAIPDVKERIQKFSAKYTEVLYKMQRAAYLAGAKSVSTEEAQRLPDGWQPINEYFGPVELK